ELVILYRPLKIVEQDIGIDLQFPAYLIKMCAQDEQRPVYLDQCFDHCRRGLHAILYIIAFEQFTDQHQPFLLTADLCERVADTLDLIEEKAFSFADIVHYVDIAENTVE